MKRRKGETDWRGGRNLKGRKKREEYDKEEKGQIGYDESRGMKAMELN